MTGTPALHTTNEARCAKKSARPARVSINAATRWARAGNISARLDDGWLITPTDACLGRLDPADIAKVDRDGNTVSGGKPSKTLALHRGIYARTAKRAASSTRIRRIWSH